MTEKTAETVTEVTATKVEATEAPAEQKQPEGNPDIEKLQAALNREREIRKAAEKEAKTRGVRLEELESAGKSDLEKAIDAARREAEAKADERVSAAQQRVNARLVAAEVRATAAEKQFRDPGMVAKLIDLSAVDVDEDGTVDTAAIVKQLDQLAKDKEYLLVDNGPKRPQGDIGQGPRPAATPETTPGLGRLRAAYADTPNK
jgi:hypothetical protein